MLMFNSVRVTHQQNVCLFCHFCHQLYESQISCYQHECLARHCVSRCHFLRSITFLGMLLAYVSYLHLTDPAIATLQDLDLVNWLLTPLALYI